MLTKIKVKTRKWGHVGLIERIYNNYWGIPWASQWWLDQQLIPFTEEELEEEWVQILCKEGGAISCPISEIEKFEEILVMHICYN